MPSYHSRKREGFHFIFFVLLPAGLCLAAYYQLDMFSVSARVGFIGGLLALWGTFLVARPIWRVGSLDWIAEENIRFVLKIDDSKMSDAERQAAHEDKFWTMLIGPIFIGVGTFLNGLSGLL